MLQERIEELNSALIKISEKYISLLGFENSERLIDFYDREVKCFASQGLYPVEDLDFSRIKDNAMFIIEEKDKDLKKYLFKVLYKNTIKFKDNENMNRSKIYRIRKCEFTQIYSIVFREQIDEKNFVEEYNNFDDFVELQKFFKEKFNKELGIAL